jgi:hypothetical protein
MPTLGCCRVTAKTGKQLRVVSVCRLPPLVFGNGLPKGTTTWKMWVVFEV